MPRLSRPQRVLLHQVHPVNLGVDVSASALSSVILWQHRLAAGLMVRCLSPPLGSALVLSFGDVERLARTSAGQYVLEHMPPIMAAIRLASDNRLEVALHHRTRGGAPDGGAAFRRYHFRDRQPSARARARRDRYWRGIRGH